MVVAFVVVVSLVTGPDKAAALPVEVRSSLPGEQVELSSGDITSNVVTWQQGSVQTGTRSASFTQVSASAGHSCGVRSDGSVLCWGGNGDGQAVAPSGSFTQVSASVGHSCGVRSDGSVVCWGDNGAGQAVAPSGSFTQVSAGNEHSCGVRSDGSVVCWGDNGAGQAVAPSGSFTQVSASYEHSCGVRSDGSVLCWGDNSVGQAVAPSGSFTQVSASGAHSCGVRSDGSVVCWGFNRRGQAVAPSGSFTQVSAGNGYSCGVRSDGSVVCWGDNRRGQAVAPSGSFTQVSAGRSHSCGVRSDGSVLCWGDNHDGKAVAPSGSFTQVSAGGRFSGSEHHSCGVRSDGSVVCWGSNGVGQAVAPSGSFTQVSAGHSHSCGVRSDGSVVCWGDNSDGQAVAPSGSFTQVSAAQVYAGRRSSTGSHSCGVRSDGSVVCWGDNSDGKAVAPSGSFTQVSAGHRHSCGVRSDGSVVCWGDNHEGRTVAPSGSFTQVSASVGHSCGVRSDGSVICWGDNSDGQAVAPSGSFTQVSAGEHHSCGVRSDGSVLCWGSHPYAEVTAPSGSFTQVSASDGYSCGVRSDGSVICWGTRQAAVFLAAVPDGGDGLVPGGSAAVPGKVARPSVSVGDGSLGVSWDAPSDGGSPIVDYDVRHVESGDIGCVDCGPLPWVDWEPSAVSASRRATIAGLANGTSYAVVVRARNSVGVGEWSDDEWGTPVASVTAPGAPRDVAVAAHGERALRVSWSAPAGGGSAVDHYRVRFGRGPLRGHPIHGDRDRWLSRVFVVRGTVALSPGLRAGVAYAVTVTAVSAAGVRGPAASATGIIAAPAELTAPRDVTAVAHGENGLRVSWSAPDSTGGSAIDHYLVKYNRMRSIFGIYDGERTAKKVDGTVATYPELFAGSSYTVSVTAVNTAGRHSPAATVTYWPPQPETPPETPAEKPFQLEQAKITNMEQLTSRDFRDDEDAVLVEWDWVRGATGFEVAYWFRQPEGFPEGNAMTVEQFIEGSKLVCEGENPNPGPLELPCSANLIPAGSTRRFETPQYKEGELQRLEVAVRAVRNDTKGPWSRTYSLPAKQCKKDTIDSHHLGLASIVAQFIKKSWAPLLSWLNLAKRVFTIVDGMLNRCESFKKAVADLIVDSILGFRTIIDSYSELKCSSDIAYREDLKGKTFISCGKLWFPKGNQYDTEELS